MKAVVAAGTTSKGDPPPTPTHPKKEKKTVDVRIFLYFFYLYFAKIYDPLEILQNYTSAVVAHGVRDITPWPTAVGAASSAPVACDGHSAVAHGVRDTATCATALCPSVVGHDSSKAASVGIGLSRSDIYQRRRRTGDRTNGSEDEQRV
jgi:hypothetical protein